MKELKSEIQLVTQKKPKCLKPCYNDLNDKKGKFYLPGTFMFMYVCTYLVEKERKAFSNNGIKIRV